MLEDKIKHLEFIQNIITRMNSNSFQIKSWAVTIVSALLAVFASTEKEYIILVAIFPVTIFWFLDAYYLMQERKFRGLYEDVAEIKHTQEIKTLSMRPDLYVKGRYSFGSSLFSTTIRKLYFSLIMVLVVLFSCFHWIF